MRALVPEGAVIEYGEASELTAPVRRGTRESLDFSVELAADEDAVLAVRDHASNALTFHAAVERRRRGDGSPQAKGSARFRVAVHDTPVVRRGPVAKLLKLAVIKLKDKLIDKLESLVIARAGEVAEALWWRKHKLEEGLFRVTPQAGALKLSKVAAGEIPRDRALLLLHGTFSNAAAAFEGLATSPGAFFSRVQPLYGNRIFAYDHFTISRTPEQNARDLLARLPERTTHFDVITHSRGGLVLRELCERSDAFGSAGRRFALDQGVLVASPNRGTPLATPARWQQTLGLVANLLEMVPDNPLTTGADFVATGLLWLAKHITGDLPGLASMDGDGATIEALQAAGGPATGRYASLGASFQGDRATWQRLLDAGVDAFFAGANDLVVPAEGSWLVDAPGSVIPADRIGCFGPGGNLKATRGDVHHLNLFDQAQSIEFLLHALGAGGTAPAPLDPRTSLPIRKLFRGGAPAGMAEPLPELRREPPPTALPAPSVAVDDYATDTLQIMILGPLDGEAPRERSADSPALMILGMYGSARVLEPFPTRDPRRPRDRKPKPSPALAREPLTPGKRFARIIATQESIHKCLDGEVDRNGKVPELPNPEELRSFGELLFEALFVEGVRRLYDVARSEQHDRALNIVLTCTVPWLAALPWEFACDPERRKFLTTEEVHLIRNVLTSVPAQTIPKRKELRILIVSAQPRASEQLAIADEEERLKHGFHSLIAAGLARVDVLIDASAARLHDQIQARDIEGMRYDVVHFIGHGQFDTEADSGKLLFLTSDGGKQEIDVRTLREILCGRGIHLVFLNACDTAREGRRYTSRNRGVAQALVEGGLPAVVANQYKVLDSAAVAFSERFYWSLALGASLGHAAREARIAVNYSVDGEAIDWAVPVLYARDPAMRLCARWDKAVPKPVRSSDESAETAIRSVAALRSRAPELAPLRVAIGDMARYFGGLPEVVERMNAVQTRFVFQLARVVAPLGVWMLAKDEDEPRAAPIRYLVAERLATKLEPRRRALGVDFLACITDQRMCSDDTADLYGWWSSDETLPVLVFSTWNLALPARGNAAGRVIANHLVTGLAAQLLEANNAIESMHRRGPTTCPFYYNEDRDVTHITSAATFDHDCRRKLKAHLPKSLNPDSLLTAFDALLNAFDGARESASPGSAAGKTGRARSGRRV